MHECYTMQILETKKNMKSRKWSQDFEMKHIDHVRKTQLNKAFCIHKLLDATLVLELLFRLE